MKILREGKIKEKTIKFVCWRCDCVYIAEEGEYAYCGNQRDGDMWRSTCPCCHSIVYATAEGKMGW